jgi:Arc-like DNA binding domain
LTPIVFGAKVSEEILWRRKMARKVTDTVQLKLRFSERLRRQLEQAAKHNRQSLNSEIVDRLYVSFEKEAQEKAMGDMVQQAIDGAAFGTGRKLEEKFGNLIVDQMARLQEAIEHLAPANKEEHSK